MSAYRVPQQQISAIVAWHPATLRGSATLMRATSIRLAALLDGANRRNLHHLYGTNLTEEERAPANWSKERFLKLPVSEPAMLKLVDHFEYQCCDTPAWQESPAAAALDVIRSALLASLSPVPPSVTHARELAAYAAAPWGLHD